MVREKYVSIVLLSCVLFCAGCASVPFEKVEYVPVALFQPKIVRNDFAQALPVSFETINSVSFSYRHIKFAALGITSINRKKQEYAVVAMNQLGVKFFEFTGEGEKVLSSFAIEEFAKRENLIETIVQDVRRIYFNNVPPEGAEATKHKKQIVFESPFDNGVLRHYFAGAEMVLVEKRFYEQGSLEWNVRYFEYVHVNGTLYPHGAVYKNKKYGYTLTVTMKEVLA